MASSGEKMMLACVIEVQKECDGESELNKREVPHELFDADQDSFPDSSADEIAVSFIVESPAVEVEVEEDCSAEDTIIGSGRIQCFSPDHAEDIQPVLIGDEEDDLQEEREEEKDGLFSNSEQGHDSCANCDDDAGLVNKPTLILINLVERKCTLPCFRLQLT
eukprot:m.238824 g.238824  ORF g.238824 m.238824 type:complete len:163 (+) comp40173_c0_seq13:414-902(+)